VSYSTLALWLPCAEHPTIVCATTIIRLPAHDAAPHPFVCFNPASGQPQPLACPCVFQPFDTPTTSAALCDASPPFTSRSTPTCLGHPTQTRQPPAVCQVNSPNAGEYGSGDNILIERALTLITICNMGHIMNSTWATLIIFSRKLMCMIILVCATFVLELH